MNNYSKLIHTIKIDIQKAMYDLSGIMIDLDDIEVKRSTLKGFSFAVNISKIHYKYLR